MSIEAEVTVELARVEVSDAYQVELTVRDTMTGDEATVSLSWSQTHDLMDELQAAVGEATSAFWEDREKPMGGSFGFDLTPAICRDCGEGKHGACTGSALTERGKDIVEVACLCTADGHRGRS